MWLRVCWSKWHTADYRFCTRKRKGGLIGPLRYSIVDRWHSYSSWMASTPTRHNMATEVYTWKFCRHLNVLWAHFSKDCLTSSIKKRVQCACNSICSFWYKFWQRSCSLGGLEGNTSLESVLMNGLEIMFGASLLKILRDRTSQIIAHGEFPLLPSSVSPRRR